MENEEIKETTKTENGKKRSLTVSGRLLAAVSCGLGGALLVLRIYQLLAITDFDTGFFTSPKSPTVTVFYVLFVLFVLLAAVLSKLSDTHLKTVFTVKKDLVHGSSSLLLAVGFARETAVGFRELVDRINVSGLSPAVYIKENKAYSQVLAPVFALLAAVILILTALSAFSGRNLSSKLRLMHLAPPMWLFTVTVGYFGVTASYLKEPQFMLLIFATVFFMLFMFEYARYACSVSAKSSKGIFLASGIISIGLFIILLTPMYLAAIFKNNFAGIANADFAWWQAAAPVFALSALYTRLGDDEPQKAENTDSTSDAAENGNCGTEENTDAAENGNCGTAESTDAAENVGEEVNAVITEE